MPAPIYFIHLHDNNALNIQRIHYSGRWTAAYYMPTNASLIRLMRTLLKLSNTGTYDILDNLDGLALLRSRTAIGIGRPYPAIADPK